MSLVQFVEGNFECFFFIWWNVIAKLKKKWIQFYLELNTEFYESKNT